MSLSLRILSGFGLVTLLMVGIGLFALVEISDMRDVTDRIVTRDIAAYRQADAVHDAQIQLSTLRLVVSNSFFNHQAAAGVESRPGGAIEAGIAAWERQADMTASLLADAERTVAGFAELARDPVRRDVWRSVMATYRTADQQLRQIHRDNESAFTAMRAGDTRTALDIDTVIFRERTAFDQLMTQAAVALDSGVRAGQARVERLYAWTRDSLILAVLAAIAVAVAITLVIRASVTRPLGAFLATIEAVGHGDLSVRAEGAGAAEIVRLGTTLNGMLGGLRAIARQSREATETLNVSVAEIRASTQQQAAGIEQQLAAVQETAATVDEIAHSGTQISRRAQEVIASAQATAQASAGGLAAVQEAGRAMAQIESQGEAVAGNIVALSEKTEAIGEIVTSVNDISERSHLLALNAAIEAASAGEHGRSFAVVAAEMKTLADQAKEATGQVRSILGDIQRGINTSVMLTEEAVKRGAVGRERTELAQASIEEMAAGIQDAVQTFQQIVASTNQQQLGIEQVMTALANIRQASQQTASGTRQLDAAALGLGELSRQLQTAAEQFRL